MRKKTPQPSPRKQGGAVAKDSGITSYVGKLTISGAAREFGVAAQTIKKRMHEKGHNLEACKEYSVKEYFEALSENPRLAAARLANARADDQERLNRISSGESIPLEDNLAWQEKVLLPIRQALMALPGTQSSRCNPADPTFAHAALDAWVRQQLPLLRNEIAGAKATMDEVLRERIKTVLEEYRNEQSADKSN